MFIVYGLSEDGGPLRYVGTTTKDMRERLEHHVNGARREDRPPNTKDTWLVDALARDVAIAIRHLETVNEEPTRGALDAAESRWIARLTADGCVLLNDYNVGRAFALYGWASPEVGPGAAELWRIIDARRLTMADVGRAVGVSGVTVGNWLSGLCVPRGAVRERFRAWLDGEPDTLRDAVSGGFTKAERADRSADHLIDSRRRNLVASRAARRADALKGAA